MKEWEKKKFNFEKDLYACHNCGKTFYLYFITSDYGYLHLICNRCAKMVYVNTFEDEEYLRLEEKYSDMYPNYRKLDLDAPIRKKFRKEFEDTCDPCDCGGKFIYEAEERCPYCLSDNIEELRIKKEFDFVEMIPNWVTHEKMKKKKP